MRPLVAEIDLAALQANFRLIASKAFPAKCIAVVKADAYGHGVGPVVRALRGLADKLAVASLDEAREVRAAGFDGPLLILEGFFSGQELLNGNSDSQLEWMLHCPEQVAILESSSLQQPCKVWLKINTGMNRLGFSLAEFESRSASLEANAKVMLLGVVSHFACADEPDHPAYLLQAQQMRALAAEVPGHLDLSVANSAATLLYSEWYGNWVRPGICLYGGSPQAGKTASDFGLQPVMTFKSEIIACRSLAPGATVGYGATWQAANARRMGVVAAGYADGYPRQVSNGTPVLIDGKQTCVIGRISMDMLTVDLTPIPGAGVGSKVELWGANLPADLIARYAGTISYHLFTGVTRRVPRVYSGNGEQARV